MRRLTADGVACWVLKSSLPPEAVVPGWRPGAAQDLDRCVRPSYRLALMAAGQPVLLWLSGRHEPGVHAVGVVTAPVVVEAGGPVVPVRLGRLDDPVARAELLADPVAREAEVLRMPAGSNPSWLSGPQYRAVLARVRDGGGPVGLGPWIP
jgi:hypothetical protein